MVSNLRKQQIASSLGKGRVTLADRKVSLASETASEDLWDKLQKSNAQVNELETLLDDKTTECSKLQSDFNKLADELSMFRKNSVYWKEKHQKTYKELRAARQIAKRAKAKADKLAKQFELLETSTMEASKQQIREAQESDQVLVSLRKENEKLYNELSKSVAEWTKELEQTCSKLEASTTSVKKLKQQTYSLHKKVVYSKKAKEVAVAAAKEKIAQRETTHHLMKNGVYTETTRNIVCLLVKAGCSRSYVGEVITTVLESVGITAIGKISRPSVGRFIREGFFAAQVQLGHELNQAKSTTLSGDSTGHRAINYTAHHIHLEAEKYSKKPEDNSNSATKKVEHELVTRSMGVQSSKDASSEEAIEEWNKGFNKIVEIYNNSPLAKRTGSILTFVDIMIKITGMNSDHCAKEKKDARLLQKQKEQAVDQHLGQEKLLDMTLDEVHEYFKVAEKDMIKKAGGQHKWDSLSDIKKMERKARMIEEATAELGKEAFEELSDEEKHVFRLFVWTGCGCHKDLNTVRGGYLAMLDWWIENEGDDIEGPVLLANRDNDPVVTERASALEQGDTPTPAQERAFSKSMHGAIKIAEIAGAIFNHKDDKKGHHDIFRYWWQEHVGVKFTFPDTSNNRFQSFCDAAAALILYTEEFKEFIECLRINKQNSTLNHMENNLWKGLHCQSTMTELAVLAIYAEAVSYPYMKYIRNAAKNKVNMLDLGPFHMKVYNHIQNIIEDPDILIGKDVDISESYKTATLNGEEWENSNVVKKILDLIPTLPHFRNLLIAFFKGAAETWERFTSEFAPGGLIDEASAEDKKLAWLPPTNDENEGALGEFRHSLRYQPMLTLLDYNAQSMFFRNNTQSFMAAKFTKEEDYRYIHKLARETNGEERKRCKELVEFRDKRQAEKTARKEVREKNAQAAKERIAQLDIILDKDKVPGLKGQALKDQLRLFRQEKAPNLMNKALPTKVDDIRKEITNAIDLYLDGTWKIAFDLEIEEEDSECSQNEVDSEEDDEISVDI